MTGGARGLPEHGEEPGVAAEEEIEGGGRGGLSFVR